MEQAEFVAQLQSVPHEEEKWNAHHVCGFVVFGNVAIQPLHRALVKSEVSTEVGILTHACCEMSLMKLPRIVVSAIHIRELINFSRGERALMPALPWSYPFRNSFHSATPCALRMSAETGSSFGARGTESSLRPASCGRRSALRWFTSLADQTRFSQASLPPRERGTTWSRLPSFGCNTRPVY